MRRPFLPSRPERPPSIFERIGAAINWIISHLFGLLGQGGSILFGVLVLAAIPAFVIYRLRGVMGGRRALHRGPARAGDDPEREWELALAAAQRGDYREATRRAFRSALLDVADRRAHLDRAWTTRELLATLTADTDLLAAVAPAARRSTAPGMAVRRWAPPTGRSPAHDARPSAAWPVAPRAPRMQGRRAREPAAALGDPHIDRRARILAVIAISSAIPPNDQANPSSRSAGSLGTLALYTWFSDLGLDVGRLSTSFNLGASDVVICYDPTVALTTWDVNSLMTFLGRGGDVVLVVTPDSLAAAAPLLGRLGVNPSARGGKRNCHCRAAIRQHRSTSIRSRSSSGLTFSDQGRWSDARREEPGGGRDGARCRRRPCVRPGRYGAAFQRRAPPSRLSFLALSLLQRARGGRISFDEYHHGEGTQAGGAEAIFDGPVGLATLLIGLVVLLAIALNGRRLGKPASGRR